MADRPSSDRQLSKIKSGPSNTVPTVIGLNLIVLPVATVSAKRGDPLICPLTNDSMAMCEFQPSYVEVPNDRNYFYVYISIIIYIII